MPTQPAPPNPHSQAPQYGGFMLARPMRPRYVDPMSAISTIRNLGPAMEAPCANAGINSAEELRAMGADAAYTRLIQHGTRPHFISYYVLHMALQGRPWNDCKGAEKEALRASFDQIKSSTSATPRSELDRFMDEIGLIDG